MTGRPTRLLRPPYGAATATTRALAAQNGYRLTLWDVDPQHWRRPGVSSIVRTVTTSTGNGDVILMHDDGGDRGQTVAALSRVVTTMKARGYSFEAME